MIERVVYVSRAAPGIGAREVYDIIRRALNRNGQLGLTGALLFADGTFAQVLEGEGWRVRERLARIMADPRHLDIDVRLQAAVAARAFPQDWMALRLSEDLDPELLQRWGYVAGLPAACFDGPRVLQFVQACCGATLAGV